MSSLQGGNTFETYLLLTYCFRSAIDHDEDLEGPICRSFKWTPRTAYRFFAGEDSLPHYMITLVHEFPPKEELLHAEMLSITAGMIMQLRDPTLSDHTTMPVRGNPFLWGAWLTLCDHLGNGFLLHGGNEGPDSAGVR